MFCHFRPTSALTECCRKCGFVRNSRGDGVIAPYRLFADLCVWHNYICNSINIFAAERHTGRSLPTVDKLQKGVKTHSSPESLFDNCALAAITVGNDLCVVPQCTSWHGTVTDRSLRIIINLCVIHAFLPTDHRRGDPVWSPVFG